MKQRIADIALVAANYNNGQYLKEFLESILASSILPSSVIIVDDGSEDESVQILRKYENLSYANFIYSTSNEGFAHALNKGIATAKTKYIMRADPDDILLPLKIEKQLNFLEDHPEVSGVGCNVLYFQGISDKVLNRSNFPLTAEDIRQTYIKGEHGLQHPTVMVRAEVFQHVRYLQEHVPAEDYDLFARLINQGHQFMNISDVLYKMRIHETSASSNIRINTIKKTFTLRDEIFGGKTSSFRIRCYYYYILNYRRYLIEHKILKKLLFLGLSVICYPKKLYKRICRWH